MPDQPTPLPLPPGWPPGPEVVLNFTPAQSVTASSAPTGTAPLAFTWPPDPAAHPAEYHVHLDHHVAAQPYPPPDDPLPFDWLFLAAAAATFAAWRLARSYRRDGTRQA
jgi:hypothetical protein